MLYTECETKDYRTEEVKQQVKLIEEILNSTETTGKKETVKEKDNRQEIQTEKNKENKEAQNKMTTSTKENEAEQEMEEQGLDASIHAIRNYTAPERSRKGKEREENSLTITLWDLPK